MKVKENYLATKKREKVISTIFKKKKKKDSRSSEIILNDLFISEVERIISINREEI